MIGFPRDFSLLQGVEESIIHVISFCSKGWRECFSS